MEKILCIAGCISNVFEYEAVQCMSHTWMSYGLCEMSGDMNIIGHDDHEIGIPMMGGNIGRSIAMLLTDLIMIMRNQFCKE